MAPGTKKLRGAALAEEKRLQIAKLVAQGKSIRVIAGIVHCTPKTVLKWKERAANGNLHVLPRSGRPKKYSEGFKRYVIRLMKGKQNHQVRVMARRTGASTTIIRQWTKEFHLKPYHIRRRFPSTAPTRVKRLKFATDYLKEPALVRNGIFVDECHFSLRKMPNRKNAVVYDTSAYNVPAVSKYQHESTVRVWGGISIHGKTNLVFYDGTLNADRYIDQVLAPELEPFCARIGKDHHCIMLQDNAPIHKSKKVQAWLNSSDIPDFIDAAEWPGYSPDLNPVEHIWAHLAERVHRSHVPNKQALARRLKKEWEKMDPCFVEKVCLSMKARLEQCIERAGRPTDY